MDMHSGGGSKESYEYIYIEAPENEAKVIFYNRFGHNPERVTCTCCGEDYSISENESLEQLSGYDRGCDYNRDIGYIEKRKVGGYKDYQTLNEYIKSEGVLFITKEEIKDDERVGELPMQGYIWMD